MLNALDKGLADFDLSSQPRVRMVLAIVLTNHGLAISPASSYSPLVKFIFIYPYFVCQQKSNKSYATITFFRAFVFFEASLY